MWSLDILIVESPALVAVTWSAAIHVIGQTPVLRLQGKEERFVYTHTHIYIQR